MTRARDAVIIKRPFINGIARVIGRSGFALVGALCGLFVADHMARTDVDAFDSAMFFLATMLSGIAGFYLGIDVPLSFCQVCRAVVADIGSESKVAVAGLFSAAGTFLTAVATLISVSVVVLDEPLPLIWSVLVGMSWLIGVMMQIAAGVMTCNRHRPA